MKTFVVGDIHGHRIALETLLAALPFGEDDRLVFLGDYVDKGPDVRATLDLLCRLSTRANTIFLRGNHDRMLIDAHRSADGFALWECLAGSAPLGSYGEGPVHETIRKIPATHWDFLERTCVDFFETEDFIFVHGGIRPDRAPAEEEAERLQWTTLSAAAAHSSGRTVICGHSANEAGRIVDLGHTICLDTGITKGGWLTGLELGSFDFHQATEAGAIRSGRLR